MVIMENKLPKNGNFSHITGGEKIKGFAGSLAGKEVRDLRVALGSPSLV